MLQFPMNQFPSSGLFPSTIEMNPTGGSVGSTSPNSIQSVLSRFNNTSTNSKSNDSVPLLPNLKSLFNKDSNELVLNSRQLIPPDQLLLQNKISLINQLVHSPQVQQQFQNEFQNQILLNQYKSPNSKSPNSKSPNSNNTNNSSNNSSNNDYHFSPYRKKSNFNINFKLLNDNENRDNKDNCNNNIYNINNSRENQINIRDNQNNFNSHSTFLTQQSQQQQRNSNFLINNLTTPSIIESINTNKVTSSTSSLSNSPPLSPGLYFPNLPSPSYDSVPSISSSTPSSPLPSPKIVYNNNNNNNSVNNEYSNNNNNLIKSNIISNIIIEEAMKIYEESNTTTTTTTTTNNNSSNLTYNLQLKFQYITPLESFRIIFFPILSYISDEISKTRESSAKTTYYLGSRFPINFSTIESFIVVSLFINCHSLERISDYWSSSQAKSSTHISLIPKILSRNKYFEIKSALANVLSPQMLNVVQNLLNNEIAKYSTNDQMNNTVPNQFNVNNLNNNNPLNDFKSSNSKLNTPVKHRNSTKELAAFNVILGYALMSSHELFNRHRKSSTTVCQFVEILTDQICSSESSNTPVTDFHQLNPSTKKKHCFNCKFPTTTSSNNSQNQITPVMINDPTTNFKCSKCYLFYHQECFNLSHNHK